MHKYLIFIILFYACDNPTASKIPPIYDDEGSFTYEMNLQSLDVGQYINYVTINWMPYNNETNDFISYIIHSENETLLLIEDASTTSYQLDLNPNQFYKLYLDMNSDTKILTDSIQTFTRPIKPITEFTAIADSENWFTSLNWTASEEIESNFSHYNIYRSFETHDIFNSLETCNCLINTIDSQNIASYTDSINLVWGGEYYYMIETITNQDYKRESIITSNILNPSYNPQITNEDTYASDSDYNKIIINWNYNLNETQFYSLEIWRSNSEDVDPFNQTQLATITDYNKNDFEDYYLIGDGLMWFYKLKLIDVYGNINESELIVGNSHP